MQTSHYPLAYRWGHEQSTGTVRTLYVYKAQKMYPVQLFPGNCNVTNTNNNYYTCPTTANGAFAMKRADGYAMVGGLVQGARTYDPTSGQWLTPDPYAGDIRDPLSQKPFMWNNNNPVQWSDPSGYEGCEPGTCGIDPIHPPQPPANAETYGKLEGHIGPASVSITVTERSGAFLSLGATGNLKTVVGNLVNLTKGRLSAGASLTGGVCLPSAGKSCGDVLKEGSGGMSLSVGEGINATVEGQRNGSGFLVGGGISLGPPGLNASGGYGVRVTDGAKQKHAATKRY